jgi:tRNA U34 5-methylaminomethyl-2-thiouridine-forming methyltransferase MnmC
VENPALISVGLGLGYNEILIVCESIRQGRMPRLIHSYESVGGLVENFRGWIQDKESELAAVYDAILNLYAEKYAVPASAMKFRLQDLLAQNKLILDGAITAETVPPFANGICFDAFSSKTSPELWTEEFLNRFFKNAAMEKCFLSTYACTGALKRALKNSGFTVEIKKGFGVKRESTFASKDI